MKKIICNRIEKYFRKWFDLWEQKKNYRRDFNYCNIKEKQK